MESFTIRLAGQYFEICPVCDYIREYCKDYIVADDAVHGIGDSATVRETGEVTGSTTNGAIETPSHFHIATTQSDIDFEREKSAREDIKEGIPIRHFFDAYLETLAVYRKIADRLLSCDTLLFHGSVIAVYPLIVQQTNRSLSADGMKQTLSLIDRMLNVMPVYRLGCNMDIEAARVAYEGMNRLKKQEEL